MPNSPDHEDSVSEPVRSAIVSKLCRHVGIVLVLYVLAPGPICLLFEKGFIQRNGTAGEILRTIYTPLAYVYDNVSSIESFYDWYLDFFR